MRQDLYVENLEGRLEEQLTKVIAVFQNLSESELMANKNGGWSVAECLEHLNSYYLYYLPRLEQALSKTTKPAEDEFKPGYIGSFLIRMMDVQQSQKKYKAIRRHQPSAIQEGYPVVMHFIQNSEKLLTLIRQSRNRSLKRTIRTSLSPLLRMNVGDTMLFLLVHNERHLLQAQGMLTSDAPVKGAV